MTHAPLTDDDRIKLQELMYKKGGGAAAEFLEERSAVKRSSRLTFAFGDCKTADIEHQAALAGLQVVPLNPSPTAALPEKRCGHMVAERLRTPSAAESFFFLDEIESF